VLTLVGLYFVGQGRGTRQVGTNVLVWPCYAHWLIRSFTIALAFPGARPTFHAQITDLLTG
jgi:hypothetical protein